MRKVVFMIDGWFMRKRVRAMDLFPYTGPEIRRYCLRHLDQNRGDVLYRIFYYDCMPLEKKGHNPITGKAVDFSRTPVAVGQKELLDSIRNTPNFALRLGHAVWRDNMWAIKPAKLKRLLRREIGVDELDENDVSPVIHQKAVDMKMGLDIAQIAMKRLADHLVLIAGDADVVPALKLARREGMTVGLDPLWNHIQPQLGEHVDYVATRCPRPSRSRV